MSQNPTRFEHRFRAGRNRFRWVKVRSCRVVRRPHRVSSSVGICMGMGGSSAKPLEDLAVQPSLWGITHPIAEKPKPKSAPVTGAKQDGALIYLLAACTAAVSVVSAWLVRDDMYDGRSAAHVWWFGWVTALSTGLGALPVAACRGVSDWFMGLANALAAGMMCAASYALLSEGFALEPEGRSAITPVQGVLLGMVSGAAFVAISQKVLDQFEDVHLGIVEGVDARKVCGIRASLAIHLTTSTPHRNLAPPAGAPHHRGDGRALVLRRHRHRGILQTREPTAAWHACYDDPRRA